MPSKKRKAAESDDSTPAASSSPVDLSKMSDKVRKKYLSDLVRQNKEIENAGGCHSGLCLAMLIAYSKEEEVDPCQSGRKARRSRLPGLIVQASRQAAKGFSS